MNTCFTYRWLVHPIRMGIGLCITGSGAIVLFARLLGMLE